MALVGNKRLGVWQHWIDQGRALMVTHLSFCEKKDNWPAGAIANRAAWSSARLSCGRSDGVNPPFEQTGGRPMRLKMCAVDHHAFGWAALGCKVGEDSVEDTHAGPANELVVERLVGAIDRGAHPAPVVSGPLVIRHTDKAARSLWPTSLLRNRGSYHSEEPGVEIL
jgi:hypothetical protein